MSVYHAPTFSAGDRRSLTAMEGDTGPGKDAERKKAGALPIKDHPNVLDADNSTSEKSVGDNPQAPRQRLLATGADLADTRPIAEGAAERKKKAIGEDKNSSGLRDARRRKIFLFSFAVLCNP